MKSQRKIKRRKNGVAKKARPASTHRTEKTIRRKIRRRSAEDKESARSAMLIKNREARFKRNIEAFDLRCEGRSYAEIGDHFGVCPKTAFNYCKAAMAAIAQFSEKDNSHIITFEVNRMDKLLRGMWDAATNGYLGYDRKGNQVRYPPSPKHVDAVMKIMKRKAEMLGLDKPKKNLFGEDPDHPITTTDVEAKLVDTLTRLAKKSNCNTQDCLPESELESFEELVPIKSTNIKKAGYNPETEVLTILFKTGKCYEYLEVSEKVWDEFLASKSAGSFFHKNIKNAYEWMEVKQ